MLQVVFKGTLVSFLVAMADACVCVRERDSSVIYRILTRVLYWFRWRLLLGFMLVTMFLSMWISNTATTAMMVPIVDAVLQKLFEQEQYLLIANNAAAIAAKSCSGDTITSDFDCEKE